MSPAPFAPSLRCPALAVKRVKRLAKLRRSYLSLWIKTLLADKPGHTLFQKGRDTFVKILTAPTGPLQFRL